MIELFLIERTELSLVVERTEDEGSHAKRTLWRRLDNGEVQNSPRKFGPGACWYAPWLAEWMKTKYWDNWPEGKAPIVILTPGGEWMPESRASNCTMKEDRTHRCWCLHGEGLKLTADKNGHTCSAGAGSIQCNEYHGFLRDGYLVQ